MLKVFTVILLFVLAKGFLLPSQPRLSAVLVTYPGISERNSQQLELLPQTQSQGTYHPGTHPYGNKGLGWKPAGTGHYGPGWRAGSSNSGRYGGNFGGNTGSYGWKHG